MGQAALSQESVTVASRPKLSVVPSNSDLPIDTGKIIIIGAVLILLQLLDGILTATGVHTFGLYAEGNPLLRSLMTSFGTIPAIVIAKTACIALTIALCYQAFRMRWISFALHCVAGLYAIAAVIPWTIILTMEYAG